MLKKSQQEGYVPLHKPSHFDINSSVALLSEGESLWMNHIFVSKLYKKMKGINL